MNHSLTVRLCQCRGRAFPQHITLRQIVASQLAVLVSLDPHVSHYHNIPYQYMRKPIRLPYMTHIMAQWMFMCDICAVQLFFKPLQNFRVVVNGAFFSDHTNYIFPFP